MSVNSNETPPEVPTIGKKFGFWSIVGILICCSGAWEGLVASMAQSLIAGSAVSLLWSWVVVSFGMLSISASLAEMASRWPTAGGQYHWVAELSPPKTKNVLSFYTCLMAIAALLLGEISCAMGVAVQLQSYAMLSVPTYEPQRWHAFLIVVLQTFIFVAVNIFYVKGLHAMNMGVIFIHVAGFFAVIITLLVCTPQKNTAEFVFTHFENNVGWESDGVAWSVGTLSSIFAFFSLDAACHYSEEVENAQVVVPRAMMIQVGANALMTWPFIIVVLFCIGDVDELMGSPLFFNSVFTQIVFNSTGSVAASIILNLIATSIAFGAGFDLLGAAARMVWTLSRDHALPPMFSVIHPKWDVPVNAILVLIPPAIVVPMIYIWNSTAFYGIMAGVLVFFQLSYIIPIILSIIKRFGTAHVKPVWNLGRFGLPIDIFSCCFSAYVIIFQSFPVYQPVTAETMNYSCAIVGVVIILSTILWFAYARKHYKGPIYTHSLLEIIDGQTKNDHEAVLTVKSLKTEKDLVDAPSVEIK